MALKPCRECRQPISTSATSCPKCGAPTGVSAKARGSRNIGCGTFIVLLLLIGGVMSAIENSRKADEASAEAARVAALPPAQRAAELKRQADAKAAQEAEQRLSSSVYACREFVTKRLRDPDSAQWDRSSEAYRQLEKDGTYHVQVKGRAKNGFGGYNFSVWDCRMSRTAETWYLISLKEIN